MESAYSNLNQPPLMSPESQDPPWWKVTQANTQQAMGDPKQRVMMAMLMQQLGKAGQGLAGGAPGQMAGPQAMIPGFDLYGMPTR